MPALSPKEREQKEMWLEKGKGGLCKAKHGIHKEAFVLLLDGWWLGASL